MTSIDRPTATTGHVVGRYAIYGEIAAGGMATVHWGRLLGPIGFSRTVAVKRLLPQYAKDESFVSMFIDEARLASRIHHPNVVGSLDVVAENGELLLVMEYVHGETLARLLRAAEQSHCPPAVDVVCGIVGPALSGLHAAHQATDEHGDPLGIVHRDFTPQNIMIGVDGVARLLDFGVARAVVRSQTTSTGQLKGKIAYMAPEQLRGDEVDARTDVFAAGVVLWEALTMRRLFQGKDVGDSIGRVLSCPIDPPGRYRHGIPGLLDAVVLGALARDPGDRFQSAGEFTAALENAVQPASPRRVAEWVRSVAADTLAARASQLAGIETTGTYRADPGEDTRRTVPSLRVVTETSDQIASLAVSTHPSRATKLRKGGRWRWAGTVGLVLAAAAVVSTMRIRAADTPGPSQPMLASSGPASKSAPGLAVSTPLTATPIQTPGSDAASRILSVDMLPPDPGTVVPEKRATRAVGRSTRPRLVERQPPPPDPPAPDCNPPFRVDSEGIRRIRPECL